MCWQQCKLKISCNRDRNCFRAKMIKFSAEWCKAPWSTVICTRKEESLAVSVTLRKTFLCALWQGMSNKMSLNCSTTIAFFLLLCKCHGSSPLLKQMRHSTPLTTNRSSWLTPGTQHQWYQSAPSLLLPGLWLHPQWEQWHPVCQGMVKQSLEVGLALRNGAGHRSATRTHAGTVVEIYQPLLTTLLLPPTLTATKPS